MDSEPGESFDMFRVQNSSQRRNSTVICGRT